MIELNDSLIKQIILKTKETFEDKSLEDDFFILDDVEFSFAVNTCNCGDDGRQKYFYFEEVGQLYAKRKDNEQVFNFFVRQTGNYTGSYYTDWYYSYDSNFEFFKTEEVYIPAKTMVIPAHTATKEIKIGE